MARNLSDGIVSCKGQFVHLIKKHVLNLLFKLTFLILLFPFFLVIAISLCYNAGARNHLSDRSLVQLPLGWKILLPTRDIMNGILMYSLTHGKHVFQFNKLRN